MGWFAIAIALAPVADRLDDAGWLAGLADVFDGPGAGRGALVALAWCAGFVGLGLAAGAVLVRHRTRPRWWFFAACAVPEAIYALTAGPRLSGLAALFGWIVAGLRVADLAAHEPGPISDRPS